MKVSRPSVHGFQRRHSEEIQVARLRILGETTDYAISNKVLRIAAKDARWQLLEAVRAARAKGETGEETGLVVRQYKIIGQGKSMRMVEEWKIDDGLLAALERTETSAANELGQLPKGDIYQDNRTQVLIQEVVGIDPEKLE